MFSSGVFAGVVWSPSARAESGLGMKNGSDKATRERTVIEDGFGLEVRIVGLLLLYFGLRGWAVKDDSTGRAGCTVPHISVAFGHFGGSEPPGWSRTRL